MSDLKVRESTRINGRKTRHADQVADVRQGVKGIVGRRIRAAADEPPAKVYADGKTAERIIDRYDELVYSMKQTMEDTIAMLDNAVNVQTDTDRKKNTRRTKQERSLHYMNELVVTARDILKKKIVEIDY